VALAKNELESIRGKGLNAIGVGIEDRRRFMCRWFERVKGSDKNLSQPFFFGRDGWKGEI